jgi:hypothetical protein
MKCPSCNKFCGLEMQDPENNNIEFDATDLDNITLSVEVHIVRNSECCGDECKEYTFNTDAELDAALIDKMEQARKDNPDIEFEAEESSLSPLEEGGHRYKKSYYGFTMEIGIGYNKPTAPRTAEQQAELDKLTNDYTTTNASPELRARRSELFAIGRPEFVSLGTVTVEDKIEASGMDELN